MPTPIKQSEIKFADPKTTVIDGVGGKALRNALVQKHTLMIAELVQGDTIVRPEEISIDDQGRVVIESEEFQKVLRHRMKSIKAAAASGEEPHFFDTNCSCGGGAK